MNTFHTRYKTISKNAYSLLKGIVTNYGLAEKETLSPRVMVFVATYACNSRCIMCNIWKKEKAPELTLSELEKTFSNTLFKRIEHVNLTGGEPLLRSDLLEIAQAMHKHMPHLRKITIPTNGFVGNPVNRLLPLKTFCNDNAVGINLRLSIDGTGSIHDKVRNVPGGFQKVLKTLDELKHLRGKIPFGLGINTLVCHENIENLSNISSLARKNDLDITFIFPCFTETFFENKQLEENFDFKNTQKKILQAFLEEERGNTSLLNSDGIYYEQIVRHLINNERRFMPCPFINQGVMLDATGELYYCQNSKSLGNVRDSSIESLYFAEANLSYRDRLAKEVCPSCMNGCMVGFGLRTELFTYLKYLCKSYFTRSPNRKYR